MKKLSAVIIIAISVVILGYYNISTSLDDKVNMSFQEISGNKSALKEDKIHLSTKKAMAYYEQIISKEGSSFKKSYEEVMDFNISKEEFENNKSFYRGFNKLDFPVYEDDQYKIIVDSSSKYQNFSNKGTNKIHVSYVEKGKDDKPKKIKLIAPVSVHYIIPICMKNINGKLVYIYNGQLNSGQYNSVIVVATIDLKKATMEKEKVIDVEKEFATLYDGKSFTTDENVYMACNSYGEKHASKLSLYAIDLKNYDLRKINIDSEKLNFDLVVENNNDILFAKTTVGRIIINKFNKDTETMVPYKEMDFPKEYMEKLEDGITDVRKENAQINIIDIKNDKLYLNIEIYKDYRIHSFVDVLDANNGDSLYKCKVSSDARIIIRE